MINDYEKIEIINKRLKLISDMIDSCNQDIQRTQDGIGEPDFTIEESNLFLNDLFNKKQALLEQKQALTNQ